MPVRPKQFNFLDPKLTWSVRDCADRFEITVSSQSFAKGVWLDLKNDDCVFSDNFFDLHTSSAVVYVNKASLSNALTLEAFEQQLTVTSYFEALGL